MSQDITASDHFCGAGGASIGLLAAGAVVTDAANHWRVACDTYERNNPNTRVHCADLSATDPRRFPRSDMGWFSPECFPAGTLILTERGLVPIEDIEVGAFGDRVLTHQGRWKLVTGTTSRMAETIVVTGQGHPGLETTAEHPFYARRQHLKSNQAVSSCDPPEWVPAEKLEGDRQWRWATPVRAEVLRVPGVGQEGPWQGRGMALDDPEFWWLVGRWLGDGTVRLRPGVGGEVTICAGDHEAEALWERLKHWAPPGEDAAGSGELRWRRRRTRTAWLFETGHQELALWLVEHFGRLAHGKTMPAWALTMPEEHRRALLEGYVSADGHDDGKTITIGTVSRSLAIGTRLLVESLGYRTSLRRYSGNTSTIEGRTVSVHDTFKVRWWKNASQRAAFDDGVHAWSLIKDVRPGRAMVEVFNISVEGDESYVADGIVVHNCRTFSQSAPPLANRMPELFDDSPDAQVERSRVSMADVIRFTDYHRYDIVMVENVVDVTRKYPIDWWYAEMCKLGYDFKVLSVNSMVAWPTPQSRDRWYACFWRLGNKAPDFEIRPTSWCAKCDAQVEAFQWWKKEPVGDPRAQCGKYRQQYLFKCSRCNGQALPYVWPALSALDLSLPCPRIGDRDKPLAEATRRRIEVGLERYGPGAIVQGAGNCFERPGYYRTWPWWRPLDSITATAEYGVAVNTHHAGSPARYDGTRVYPLAGPLPTQTGQVELGLMVPLGHGDGGPTAMPADWPGRTQTGRAENGMVIVPMRTHNRPFHPDEPLNAMTTAHGGGHVVVELPYLLDGGKGTYAAQPVAQPGQSVTADGSQFVVTLRNHGDVQPWDEPVGTLSAGGNHHGLLVRMNGGVDQAGPMGTPWDDPAGTITGAGNQAVVPFLTQYYGHARPGSSGGNDPVPTLTAKDRHAMVDPRSVEVDDCGFRMLEPHEAGRAMAFPEAYKVDGSKRTKVRLYGQAVTPPVSALISGRCIDSLAS